MAAFASERALPQPQLKNKGLRKCLPGSLISLSSPPRDVPQRPSSKAAADEVFQLLLLPCSPTDHYVRILSGPRLIEDNPPRKEQDYAAKD
jgi:hypothetical protein